MVIVMEMDSGKVITEEGVAPSYDDEVLNAGWADIPQVAPQLQVAVAAHADSQEQDAEAFLARLYAAEGLKGRR